MTQEEIINAAILGYPEVSINESTREAIRWAMNAVLAQPAQEPSQYQELLQALENLMEWQVKKVKVWNNPRYDQAAEVIERHKAAHGIKETTE
jgi:hypothetical protein